MVSYPIVHVKYRDHHWMEAGTLRDIEDEDAGKDQVTICEVGYLLKNDKDYIITASYLEENLSGKEIFKNIAKTLKSDVIILTYLDHVKKRG
jgi:hypothetical protein